MWFICLPLKFNSISRFPSIRNERRSMHNNHSQTLRYLLLADRLLDKIKDVKLFGNIKIFCNETEEFHNSQVLHERKVFGTTLNDSFIPTVMSFTI